MSKYKLTVEVKPQYLPEQSAPADDSYAFSYTVTIKNVGTQAIQVISSINSSDHVRSPYQYGGWK